MLIAHISDLHIAGWGNKAYGIAPTAENLACCVDHINQLKPAPDLVLVTGDITYSSLLEEVERAASILAQLRYPFYILPVTMMIAQVSGRYLAGKLVRLWIRALLIM